MEDNNAIPNEIKALGTKARARLEEEKQKRREIRVLEEFPTEDPARASRKRSFQKASSPTTTAATQKRPARVTRRKATSKGAVSTRKRTSNYWSPDVTHIAVSDDEVSRTVKLHGLPTGCTLEHLQTFFVGLPTPKFGILLPNDTQIRSLDASNPPPLGVIEHTRLRVLAEFPNIPVATLATERSGETVRYMDDENDEELEYPVTVTRLSKKMASGLFQLTIPPVTGTRLMETIETLSKSMLHSMVAPVLWSLTSLSLSTELPIDRKIQRARILAFDQEEKLFHADTMMNAYGQLVQHYNRLVEIHDDLLDKLSFPTTLSSDKDRESEMSAPILHLTRRASAALEAELDRLETLLYQARVVRMIGK